MHSAEHLLNGTMDKMFQKGRSFSAHIERKKSKCDYRNFDSNLTVEEIKQIEDKVNNAITSNFDVSESFISREEAEKTFSLERLPDSAGENIRVIKIGNYDSCLCIGEHVKNTNEIGKSKIISTGFDNKILRIRFKLLLEQ